MFMPNSNGATNSASMMSSAGMMNGAGITNSVTMHDWSNAAQCQPSESLAGLMSELSRLQTTGMRNTYTPPPTDAPKHTYETFFPTRRDRMKRVAMQSIAMAALGVIGTIGWRAASPHVVTWWNAPDTYTVLFDCPNCGSELEELRIEVGTPITSGTPFTCGECGVTNHIASSAQFRGFCGTKVIDAASFK